MMLKIKNSCPCCKELKYSDGFCHHCGYAMSASEREGKGCIGSGGVGLYHAIITPKKGGEQREYIMVFDTIPGVGGVINSDAPTEKDLQLLLQEVRKRLQKEFLIEETLITYRRTSRSKLLVILDKKDRLSA